MSYEFQSGKMYRMPTHFGPRTGPRCGPDGKGFDCIDNPKSLTIAVSFLGKAEQLENLLPPRFELAGDPIATVHVTHMKEIEWLAGRGYSVMGVSIPATYNGDEETVTGSFLTVLWENLTDPIITGREELGFSKIYCELPEPTVLRGDYHSIGSWLGFKFIDIKVDNTTQQSDDEITALNSGTASAGNRSAGTLHYKYMPRTGEWGTADVEYAVLTPSEGSNAKIQERWVGEGSVEFHHARWEDMPTQYNIVNALADLDVVEWRGGAVTRSVGGKDLRDQRILK